MDKALTWDELANMYDKSHGGRKARTLPMDTIFNWAEKQADIFKVSNRGTIHLVKQEPI